MTSRSSSFPARLRRLLANDGATSPVIKVDNECPPKIKALIDKVIQSPLQDIAIPLSGFRWDYNKGNFHHWGPLFLHFDTYFKTYLANRGDLLLSDNIIEDDNPFPKNTVLQILRVMQIILENCPNKSSFSGLEHFKLLLSSTDPEVLIATLETLAALVKINPSKVHGNAKLIGLGLVNSCLMSLAQGWGSKEEGLGLYYCVMENEKSHNEGLCLFPSDTVSTDEPAGRLGSTLYFDLRYGSAQRNGSSSGGGSSSTGNLIHIPDMHLRKEDDFLLMKQCIELYNVPQELRFSLLTRIRYTHAFRTPRISRLYSRICLLAFIVLVQSHDAHDQLTSFFANEPDFPNELIRIVRCEETIPGTIRTLAMQALSAQLASYIASSDRGRILGGSSINFSGGNRMILLNVLQKAIISLSNSNDPSSLAFVEAILQFYLLHVISSSNNGGSIRGSGMVPTFLPLLEDVNPTHMHLVCSAVKTLQKLMDFSQTAVSLFKSLGGVELLAQRIETEVQTVGHAGADDNSMIVGESSTHIAEQLYLQKKLIKALLKALGSATYAPANSSRADNAHDNTVPATLALIFSNVDKFGGDIYSSAVTLMNEIIHKDPTCFTALHEAGLPQAFLSSVLAGILPSSKALTCVPNGLGAICLNAKGLEAVQDSSALRFLVDIFTLKKYVVAMNEGILPLANAVEELLRHVSSLRNSGVDVIIEIINRIAMFSDENLTRASGVPSSSNAMETDSEDKVKEDNCTLVPITDDDSQGVVSNDQFIQLCIFHVMVLVHRAIENTETCRLFVEKSGIKALLKLLLRPSIAQSSSGMSVAVHSTMVFKGFTQHHSVPLAQSVCSALKDQLKKALDRLHAMPGSFFLDPLSTSDEVFTSLFIIEFLLFLAASKDSRWVNALLAEFGNGNKDVLVYIGQLHREMLWQIALLEDARVSVEENDMVSATEEQSSDSVGNESERLSSFRQFLDPLLRRRMSGWNAESQFFELMNLYQDLSRASLQQRLGPSNTRFGLPNPLISHVAETSPAETSNKDEKQSSFYASCCEMVRSLSSHISHLFQELGKAMVSPRRRDDAINVSSSAKLVVSSFASIVQDHMAFGGHGSPKSSEASISTKCRYLGKVIDFIDGILLDRPDSCNPIVLNSLYGQGVLQSVLTTFEATSQLLFAVNRVPSSPMETDDGTSKLDEREESDRSWIHGPLASYGKLMDHLVTSAYILSPSTKHLLCQPMNSGDLPFPRDAEAFVKVLQAMVLKAVLPVWTHVKFTDCNYSFITTVISIIKHVYSGVEVKNSSDSSARLTRPPPNEATISTIVEMGFSRSRAEEALRQVPGNSVELAMEWLFSHLEEVQEDDELAHALAMSLGNSETETKDKVSTETSQLLEEEAPQLPPVDQLLETCSKLLQMKKPLAFPVRDLLVMLCSQNDGQFRSNIITFITDQVKNSNVVSSGDTDTLLSAHLHVLALIFHEDAASREVAVSNGFIKHTLDLLSQWDTGTCDVEGKHVPKWVTAAFLAIDRLLQLDQKLPGDISALFNKDDKSKKNSIAIGEANHSKLQSSFGSTPKYIDISDQKIVIEIACNCMRRHLPSDNLHAVLQLCATLSRTHSVAVSFLEAGGVSLLLSLPVSSLFAGFDNVAASIIRHVLEDPQTLQQAMESEIRHSLVSANNRHSSGRISPRNFLMNLTSAISRDPVIFVQAAQNVCQVEMVGERPYIVLTKDREKDKSKEKEKDSSPDKDKLKTSDGKVVLGNMGSGGTGNGLSKLPDYGFKNSKVHRKPPQSFTNTIELLIESATNFVPPATTENFSSAAGKAVPATDMEIDASNNKGKGKSVITVEEREAGTQETQAAIARTVFVLKLLTEVVTMYTPSIHVVLRKDAEINSNRGSQKVSVSNGSGGHGILHHVLHEFLTCSRYSKKDKKLDGDWRQKLATRANQFIVACCVRSSEARRRIFLELNFILNDFVDSCDGPRPPRSEIQAFVDLVNDILAARSLAGSYISAEASATFIDVGLVKCLTQTLRVLDLDHADSSKVVSAIVKALECITKEHVNAADVHAVKSNSKPAENDLPGRTEDNVPVSHPVEIEPSFQPNPDSSAAGHGGSFSTGQIYDDSEAVTDDMEHDQDLDEAFAPGNEDDYMRESFEDARGLENIIDSVDIHFDIQPRVQENLDEDDEDMSGDDEDEADDDEDEEHNDLDEEEEEEEEDHHMPHPDTDQDDHEVDDDDEFDEEAMEEDEDDEDDDDDGVILRLDESINGINVLDHIEVFGRDDSFGNDTLQVMPIEVFGSRRQDRTTSIYNLLSRNSDNPAPPRHPLLVEPSQLHSDLSRHSVNIPDPLLSSTSHLDAAYRSLRNGRHGQRVNLWADDNQQSGGSTVSMLPQGFEELLVSSLKRPLDEAPESKTLLAGSQNKAEGSQLGVPESNAVSANLDIENANNGSQLALPSEVAVSTSNVELPVHGESLPATVNSNLQVPSNEMQYEHNDSAVRDVEAVSQESSGSGATLDESLRSLDVEIGSADGHDDGGDRQASTDRMSIGDQIARSRRSNSSLGNSAPASGREAPLHSLTEVSENPSQEDVGAATEGQPGNSDTNTEPIDPAFLEALPAELRAEVLSAQQSQAPQPPNTDQPNTEEIDPEFLAALPPDIRAEVLAQQQAQRLHQSQELEGQPVEMDTVSIIATFPSDIREEVLLTSSDAVLANLTPALVAEANMLRERFAHRYHNRNLFGMYPRSRRGESSRRGEGTAFDRAGGVLALRSSSGGKIVEADGAPLVDKNALESMIRVLRVVQPLYKGPYQRLLLNLCAHSDTRKNLVRLLMNMLTIDIRKTANQAEAYQPLYQLYSGQSHIMYSRSQASDGIPPLLSRRILEVLTYLARSHPSVAKIMLTLTLPWASVEELEDADSGRCKVIQISGNCESLDKQQPDGYVSIVLLFSLLNQPLYLRSVVHLEHLLHLLEVVVENAEAKSNSDAKSLGSSSQQPSATALVTDTDMNVESSAGSSMDVSSSTMVDDSHKQLTLKVDSEFDCAVVLANLPQAELRLLCSLLAREGLSDSAYTLVAEVVKKLAVIAPSHSQLFVTQLADAVRSLSKSAMDELHLYGESEEALLCSSFSDGAAVLRVLQTLSSLVASLSSKETEPQGASEKEHIALSQVCGINSDLEPLWLELSSCIGRIESYSDSAVASSSSSRRSKSKPSGSTPLPAGSQNILPYIESFFVMCEKLHPGQSGIGGDVNHIAASDVDDLNSQATPQKPSGSSKSIEKHVAFVKFTERHRKLLNAFIHQNPSLLEKSFSLMLKVPRFIDFDNKRAHFRSKIKHQHDHHHSSLRISVRRAYILEDSYNQLRMRSSQDLKGRLTVRFQGEEGIDAGGLTREWYQLLSRVIFDKGALLFTTVGNDSTFQPNPNSVYQTEHLSYFKFVGRVVGKALFDGQLLDVHFTRSFYKHILGAKVTYHDIEAIDPDYFKNLKWMLENDISDVLDLTFSIDADEEKLILYERNEVTDYELIPGGRNIKVTEENKHQYVDLIAEHRLTTAIRPQINAFLEGFTELIPRELISIFNDKELELLISGLPDIDLDDMRANTEYSGYSAASPVIQWFWEVAQSFSKEDKARFLQFVTGTSKVPLEGFSALQGVSGSQKFQIHKAYGSSDHLPSAHTCFNQLDLPEYPSKAHLEERLLLAIHEGSEGFGFG